MDVFIVGLDHEGVVCPLLLDLDEALLNGSELVGGQDAIVLVGTSECNRAGDILRVEETIVRERGIVLLHDRVKTLCAIVRIRRTIVKTQLQR